MTAECSHWWKIQTANGRFSPGYCKECGEERTFRNSFDVPQWIRKSNDPNTIFPKAGE